MHVISKKAIREYGEKVPAAKGSLDAWYAEAKAADWKSPHDVKAKYGSASILKGSRVVFNICGNNHRLVVRINYESGTIFVRFLGTHQEYDQIDAGEI